MVVSVTVIAMNDTYQKNRQINITYFGDGPTTSLGEATFRELWFKLSDYSPIQLPSARVNHPVANALEDKSSKFWRMNISRLKRCLMAAVVWTPLVTNVSDSKGRFSFTNLPATNAQQFYRISAPWRILGHWVARRLLFSRLILQLFLMSQPTAWKLRGRKSAPNTAGSPTAGQAGFAQTASPVSVMAALPC
jgi:hypothetical protein